MATTGNFPSSHTTTTTTTSTRVVIAPCRFDPSYISTIPGILKLVVIILNFIGFICIMASGYAGSTHPRGSWFNFVAVTGFWVSGTLLFMYLFHGIERLHMIPWLLLEFVFCLVWTIFYLIGASLVAAWASASEAYGAAAFFGFVAMVVYGYDTFIKFRGWRSGNIAQGERQMSSSTTTATY
uniref:MARVEL domain-containing protein n=1 Tax=Strigamia maritima TaxID=126957 RepID=T1JEB9_STRMM